MAASATCGIAVALALVTFLANFSASFVYFLTPVDVANHYSCAINSSLSPKSVSQLTDSFLQLIEVTKNYTGDVDALVDKLPSAILQKLRECEAFHSHIYAESSSPSSGPSSDASANHDNEQFEHLLAEMMHCYKETDLMYFKTLKFEEDSREHVDEFHKCLQNTVLPAYGT